jgi:hypothetical protein
MTPERFESLPVVEREMLLDALDEFIERINEDGGGGLTGGPPSRENRGG